MSYVSAAMFRAIGFVSRVDGLKFIKENSIRKMKSETPEKYLQRVKRVRIDDKKLKSEIKMTMMNLQKFLSQDFTTYRVHREINEVQQSEKLTVYFDDLGDLYDNVEVEEIKTKMYEICDKQEINIKSREYMCKNGKYEILNNLNFSKLFICEYIENDGENYDEDIENYDEDNENYDDEEKDDTLKRWIIDYKHFNRKCMLYYKYNKEILRMIDFEEKAIYECEYENDYDDEDEEEYVIIKDQYKLNIDDEDIIEELEYYKLIPNMSKIEYNKNKVYINKIYKKRENNEIYNKDEVNILNHTLTKTRIYEIYNKDEFKISTTFFRKGLTDYEILQFKNRIKLAEKNINELNKKRQTIKIKEKIEDLKGYIEGLKRNIFNSYNINLDEV